MIFKNGKLRQQWQSQWKTYHIVLASLVHSVIIIMLTITAKTSISTATATATVIVDSMEGTKTETKSQIQQKSIILQNTESPRGRTRRMTTKTSPKEDIAISSMNKTNHHIQQKHQRVRQQKQQQQQLLAHQSRSHSYQFQNQNQRFVLSIDTKENESIYDDRNYRCDESKCRSIFDSSTHKEFNGFQCWARIPKATMTGVPFEAVHYYITGEDFDPLPCAPGYIGKVIDSIPVQTIEDTQEGEFQYYTCCLQNTSSGSISGATTSSSNQEEGTTNQEGEGEAQLDIVLSRECFSSFCTSVENDCFVSVDLMEPMTCSEGYMPRLVGNLDYFGFPLAQYTCCKTPPPPSLPRYSNEKSNGTLEVEEDYYMNDHPSDFNARFYNERCSSAVCHQGNNNNNENYCILPTARLDQAVHPEEMEIMETSCSDEKYKFPWLIDQGVVIGHKLLKYTCCELSMEEVFDIDMCDESKCRNFSVRNFYSCWTKVEGSIAADSTADMNCAENFVGRIVDSVPISPDGYEYYTCCPRSINQLSSSESLSVASEGKEEDEDSPTETLDSVVTPSPRYTSLQQKCDDSFCSSDQDDCFAHYLFLEPFTCREGYFPRKMRDFEYLDDHLFLGKYTCCSELLPLDNDKDDKDDNILHFYRHHCSSQHCGSWFGDCYSRKNKYGIVGEEPMTCDDETYSYPWIINEIENPLENEELLTQYLCCDVPDTNSGRSSNFWWSIVSRLVLSTVSFFYIMAFIIGILSSETRKHTFNLYLIILELPGAIWSLVTMVISILAFFIPISFTLRMIIHLGCLSIFMVNMLTSCVIVHEIFLLLFRSSKRMRTHPPTRRKAIYQAIAIYLYLFVALIFLYLWLRFELSPDWYHITYAPACGLSISYISYLCFRIWREGLLPRTDRTREISLYFGRLILIIFVFYIPGLVLLSFYDNELLIGIGALLVTLQGPVSVFTARRTNTNIFEATNFLNFTDMARSSLHRLGSSLGSIRSLMERSASSLGRSSLHGSVVEGRDDVVDSSSEGDASFELDYDDSKEEIDAVVAFHFGVDEDDDDNDVQILNKNNCNNNEAEIDNDTSSLTRSSSSLCMKPPPENNVVASNRKMSNCLKSSHGEGGNLKKGPFSEWLQNGSSPLSHASICGSLTPMTENNEAEINHNNYCGMQDDVLNEIRSLKESSIKEDVEMEC